ncbi:MAG: hypothetical protein AAGA96_12385 [Verrucomicrobiota bacterium]
MRKFLVRNYIGIAGLTVGLVAVAIAVFQNDLRPPPPEDDRTFTEVAGEAASKLIKEKILKEEEAAALPPNENRNDGIAITYMSLGFLAMVLGITSWIRRDHIRISGGAIAVGLVAVGWEYVLIGLVIGIVILVIANFSA